MFALVRLDAAPLSLCNLYDDGEKTRFITGLVRHYEAEG
jgi:hypothetical protein